tara:strand:- start:591 stop:1289 length:699 start_codon:yes stop_codon:yes gene_type:complete
MARRRPYFRRRRKMRGPKRGYRMGGGIPRNGGNSVSTRPMLRHCMDNSTTPPMATGTCMVGCDGPFCGYGSEGQSLLSTKNGLGLDWKRRHRPRRKMRPRRRGMGHGGRVGMGRSVRSTRLPNGTNTPLTPDPANCPSGTCCCPPACFTCDLLCCGSRPGVVRGGGGGGYDPYPNHPNDPNVQNAKMPGGGARGLNVNTNREFDLTGAICCVSQPYSTCCQKAMYEARGGTW